ncbi:MAG: HDIG domain-containing protein [Bacteroidaceae bacterium]|nr:HDIG domain-containing protein [Bacteroidaceae bacterium]
MTFKNPKTRNIITIALLITVCTALMISIMPRQDNHKSLYDIGHPWPYLDLYADFDFPIYKDSVELNAEKDSLRKAVEPYFFFDENVAIVQLDRFQNDFKEDNHGLSPAVISQLKAAIAAVYDKGIIENSRYKKIAADTLHNIRIIRGKEVVPRKITDFYTPVAAYDHLFENPKIEANRNKLQNVELQDYLRSNLVYDLARNREEEKEAETNVIITNGVVEKGVKIVSRGEIITPIIYQKLRSYEEERELRDEISKSVPSTIVGQILYVATMILLIVAYLFLFRRDYYEKPRLLFLLFSLITIFSILVSLVMRHTFYNVYILPFALVPMFIRVFLDSRTAFMSHVMMILICACAVKYQYEFIIIQLVAGAVAIYSMRHLTKRSDVFVAALYVTIATCIIYSAQQLMQDKTASEFDASYYKYFCFSGILLLFAYPMMYLIERLFSFTSDVTLIELSNPSNKLLRHLSMVAPGTYQHCTMVGNLAAEIAEKIGAEPQLVRTGALYHDIGKTVNPAYYIENQKGMSNPLEMKDRKEAARIIISHTTEGIRLAKAEGLPEEIIDFIRTHHGKGLTKYFYLNYKTEHPEEDVDPAEFSYDGPNPQTVEQAILMMADAVEAASRSLPDYSEKTITELVNRIIDGQVSEKYFDECPVSFRDINDAKQVLIDRLMAIYHTRIAYPKG